MASDDARLYSQMRMGMQRCRRISVIDGDSLVGLAKIEPAALQCRSRRQTDPRAAGN